MSTLAEQYDEFTTAFVDGTTVHNQRSREAYYGTLDFELQGKSVLDVGCGDGFDIALFQSLGAQCHGIDASAAMVMLAHQRAPEATFTQGRMEHLPYASETFDVVLSKYALQTSEDVPRAIHEMERVLKPGGVIVYLAVHPLRQFLEKKKHPKDYFTREVVASVFFNGAVVAREPTHTLDEYLNAEFLRAFHMLSFREYSDFPSSEQIEGDTYPCFFVLKAKKNNC